MPTLNIAGKRVTVGDEFLSMTPEQQNSTVDEIAKSIGIGGGERDAPRQPAIATNAAGDALFLDSDNQWKPARIAVNPQTKERLAWNGNEWVPTAAHSGPWEQYQSVPADGPWTAYAQAASPAPDTAGFSEDLKKLTPQVSAERSAAIGAHQGLLAGWADELSGLADASGLPVGTPPLITAPVGAVRRLMGSLGAEDAYYAGRDRFRAVQAAAEREHPYASTSGQVAGALAGAAVPASRIGTGAIRGFGLGAGLGALQGAGDAAEASDIPREAAWGAGVGGILGAAIPVVAQGARRMISPFAVSAERQAAADALRREGVGLTAGQQTGNRGLRYFESEMGGGATAKAMDRQGEQFTRAALRRAGVDAPRATPEVMDAAFERIGQAFDDFGANANIQPSRKLGMDLMRTLKDYTSVTGTSTRAPLIENTISDIAQHAQQNGGTISGKFYAAMRSDLARKARGTTNPELKQAINDVVSSLDDAMERSVSPADAAAYRTARREYRNILVLEKAASGAGEQTAEGIITPSKLRSAVQQQDKRAYVRGKGDYAELARVGEAMMKPLPQSGTGPRLMAQGVSHAVTGSLGATLGAREGGGWEGASLGALAGVAAPRLAARAVLSPIGRRYLTNQIASGPGGLYMPLANLLAQPVRGQLLEAR